MSATHGEVRTLASASADAFRPGAEWWRPASSPWARADGPSPTTTVEAAAGGGAAPFSALLAFLIILLLAPQALFPVLAPFRLALVAAVCGIAAQALSRLRMQRPVSIVTPEIVLAACLAGWAFLTAPFSYWPGGSIAILLDQFIKSLALFWLLANIVDTPARFRAVTLTMVIATVPLAAVAIAHFLSGDVAPGGNYYPAYKRIAGYDAPLTQNPNDLALTLNLLLPFSVAHLLRARGVLARTFLLGVVLLTSAAVVLTFSRAGFLTLAAMATLYTWKLSRSRQRAWVLAVVLIALVAFPLLPGSYLDRIGTIADMRSDQSGSSQARWGGMVAATGLVFEHPLLGVGAGMNILALNEAHGALWKQVHNVYLGYAADLGLPGLAMFLALLWCCFSRAWRTQRATAGVPGLGSLFQYGVAVEVSLAAFAVAGMFHPVVYNFHFYIIAGLAVALGTLRTTEALPVTD